MNILQLLPKLNVGGVEKGTVEVARHLTLNGHKAVVASGGGVLEKNLAAIGARHYNLPIGKKNPFVILYCYFRLKNIIKKENIDIVHARSRVPALTGYFAARSTNRIFLTTAHGQYKKHLISRVMGWGKVVVVANETMARHMKENFGVNLERMRIIPRGVDLDKFFFLKPSERRGKTFRVGMIARYTPLKGHLDFLKAISYVSRKTHNLEVVIMGNKSSAKEEYMNKLRLTARRLLVDKIVEFKDSDEDVATVMNKLDVLVSANIEQEAFGRTVIEAQARGVPVVATRIGGVVENIESGKTGLLCEPSNPSEMAEKIMQYAKDPHLMENVAIEARKQVEERYSLKKTMDMTLEAYKEVLSTKNILIFKISSLGDIILSVPSIRSIRERFPTASIKVLVDVRFREVLAECPYIDDVITCDLNGRDSGPGFLQLSRRLHRESFDISIDLQNNKASHLLAFLSGISERYGYNNGKMSFLLNRKIALPKKNISPIDHQGYVLGLVGITRIEKRLELWPSHEDEEWAKSFLNSNWLKEGQKIVGISLSASGRWKTKNWPVGYLAELTDTLAREKGIRVVALGTKEDRSLAERYFKKTSAKPIDAVGKTSIGTLIGIIKNCDALLTGDSSPMHIASAVETPFVALFGPTDPQRHAAPGDRKIIRKNMRCSPCYKTTCIKGIKCMTSIKPEEVFQSLMELMNESQEVKVRD